MTRSIPDDGIAPRADRRGGRRSDPATMPNAEPWTSSGGTEPRAHAPGRPGPLTRRAPPADSPAPLATQIGQLSTGGPRVVQLVPREWGPTDRRWQTR